MAMQKRNYRETLIQAIKDSGQEIIDRAEEMANSDLITDFSITVMFDQESIPDISWNTSVANRNAIKRMQEERHNGLL